jgi:hypothetical protein
MQKWFAHSRNAIYSAPLTPPAALGQKQPLISIQILASEWLLSAISGRSQLKLLVQTLATKLVRSRLISPQLGSHFGERLKYMRVPFPRLRLINRYQVRY